MDITAERQRLENEKRGIEQYLNHTISRKIFGDNEEQQKSLLDTILNVPVVDFESFVKHFEAIGHLRGLRRSKALVQDDIEEIQVALEALPNE
jgi:hypothetical protein